MNGKHYEIDKNLNGVHQLHGGTVGFDKFNWEAYQVGTKVVMTHVNPDGFQGYPGTVMAQVTYELLPDNCFSGKYTATTSLPTPINLTNHSYFNLAGHVRHSVRFFWKGFRLINLSFFQDKGHAELYNHKITLNADRYTVTDHDSIPSGSFQDVLNTGYDLRVARYIGQSIANIANIGFDDNFCVIYGTEQKMTFVARLELFSFSLFKYLLTK